MDLDIPFLSRLNGKTKKDQKNSIVKPSIKIKANAAWAILVRESAYFPKTGPMDAANKTGQSNLTAFNEIEQSFNLKPK